MVNEGEMKWIRKGKRAVRKEEDGERFGWSKGRRVMSFPDE